MQEIVIKISDAKAREWKYFLSRLHGKDKRTSLRRLVEISVLKHVYKQATIDVEDSGKETK